MTVVKIKKQNAQKSVSLKDKLKLNIIKTLQKLILKIQQRFKCEKHNVFTEGINKIALSSNGV